MSIVNSVNSAVTAGVDNNVTVHARAINVFATNHADKEWLAADNVNGTTGGLVSGAGVSSDTNITFNTLVTVGNNADVEVVGLPVADTLLTMRALNDIVAMDNVTFFTGGALSGATVNATIRTIADVARVSIGSGATVVSKGAIAMSARGTGNVVEKQNVETFGAGTITTGDALIEILPVNEVDFGDSATVTAYGDLMVSAGTDTAYSPDYYNLEARFDGIAGSLVPIDQTDAKAYLVQENNITIGSGAWLKTAREALLHAEDLGSQNDLVAKAKITSWTSGAADGLLALTGGGADQYNGHLLQEAHATVTNNGTVETGITRHQFLTLNGWDAATGAVTGTASDGVTFHTENKVLQSSLATDLQNDQQQLATYGDSNPTMKATLLADIANIQQQMIAQHLVEVESDGSLVPIVQYVMTVVVDPMWAQAGRIDVQSDQVQGSGQWIAPTDASVTITNNTPAFLELKGITIPDDNGRLFVNGILVGDNPSIQTINQAHADLDNSHNYSGVDRIITPGVAAFAAIPNATPPANQDPQVTVANTLNVNTVTDGHTYQFPNITVLGPSDGGAGIYNLGGAVTLQTTGSGGSGGSIIVNGPLFAKTQSIIAGGNVYINDPGGSVSVAGEPSSVWGAITTGVYDPVGGATAAGRGIGRSIYPLHKYTGLHCGQ